MDKSHTQLPGNARDLLPMRGGQKIDFEYMRNGTHGIFVFKNLGTALGIWTHRTTVDWV